MNHFPVSSSNDNIDHIKLFSCNLSLLVLFFSDLFQHYQEDAGGLCTRLVKPLEMEGGKLDLFGFDVNPESFRTGSQLVSLHCKAGFPRAILMWQCLFDNVYLLV